MPQLKVRELQKKSVLIVGNGPSLSVMAWPKVLASLREHEPNTDLVLLNRAALGWTSPTFAVAVDPATLLIYQRSDLLSRSQIVTNASHKLRGIDIKLLGPMLASKATLYARDEWPPHAVGPLAVWAMASLGYRTIYLYALDGSSFGSQPSDPAMLEKRREWEAWIRRFMWARRDSKHSEQRPRLVRLWPDEQTTPQRDPLHQALAETRVMT